MMSDPASLLFNFREISEVFLFRIIRIVGGESVHTGSDGSLLGEDVISHAHNCRRIESPAEVGQNRGVSAQTTTNRLSEEMAELLLILGIPLVSRFQGRIEVPVGPGDGSGAVK